MASKLIVWWAWTVAAFLVVGGAIARFGAEALFVLLSGIGMLVLSFVGFLPATSEWLYTTLHMNRIESVFELVAGLISLALYFTARSAGGGARTEPAQPPQTH